MTEACFNSKIAKSDGASDAHNEREWTEDHPEPKYIAEFAEYADPRSNEKGGQGLTRDQEKARADRAEAQPQMIMGAVPFRMAKIKLPPAGIMHRGYRVTAQAHVDQALQDRKHQIQRVAEDATRNEVAAELNKAQRDNETAAARNTALESERLNKQSVEVELKNEKENSLTLANENTVVKGENEKMKKELSVWSKLFAPLLRVYSSLHEKGRGPHDWLDRVIKNAIELAEKTLQTRTPAPAQKTQTRKQPAPDP